METKFRGLTPVVTVNDISRSVEFYVNALGFELGFIYGEPISYAGLHRDKVEIHLIDKDSPNASRSEFKFLDPRDESRRTRDIC